MDRKKPMVAQIENEAIFDYKTKSHSKTGAKNMLDTKSYENQIHKTFTVRSYTVGSTEILSANFS